jgi:hypothetical protein
MEKSYKNILQEYCQKNNLDKPYYDSWNIGITNKGTMIWQSRVSVKGLHITSIDGVDVIKKQAEQKAAALLYYDLIKYNNTNNNNNIIKRSQKIDDIQDIDFTLYSRIILVDGENCDFDMNRLLNDLVLIFVAKNTTKNKVFEYQEQYDNCFIFISDSVGQDAADHLLTFYAGILSIINGEGNYYVLTKDHYGECLEKFMKNCKFICSLDEI